MKVELAKQHVIKTTYHQNQFQLVQKHLLKSVHKCTLLTRHHILSKSRQAFFLSTTVQVQEHHYSLHSSFARKQQKRAILLRFVWHILTSQI